jgi:hypothetical protein
VDRKISWLACSFVTDNLWSVNTQPSLLKIHYCGRSPSSTVSRKRITIAKNKQKQNTPIEIQIHLLNEDISLNNNKLKWIYCI